MSRKVKIAVLVSGGGTVFVIRHFPALLSFLPGPAPACGTSPAGARP